MEVIFLHNITIIEHVSEVDACRAIRHIICHSHFTDEGTTSTACYLVLFISYKYKKEKVRFLYYSLNYHSSPVVLHPPLCFKILIWWSSLLFLWKFLALFFELL